MKKSLLTTAMLAMGTFCATAQVSPVVSQKQAVKHDVTAQQRMATIQHNPLTTEGTVSAPVNVAKFSERARQMRKAAGSVEAFYTVPDGTLFAGIYDHSENEDNLDAGKVAWYLRPDIYVPARKEQKLTNYSSWNEESSIEPTFAWTDGNDAEMEQDEEHNGIGAIWGANYVPQLTVTQGKNSDTYSLHGTNDESGETYRSVWWSYTDAKTPLTNAYMPGTTYSGFSDCASGNNFRGDEANPKIVGFSQTYEAVAGHVWAENAYVFFFNDGAYDAKKKNTKPLEGKTLTLNIYTFDADGNQVLYTSATATDENIVGWSGDYAFKLNFPFVEEDPALGVLESPIVLPNEDFYITITGFDGLSLQPLIQYRGDDGLAGNCYYILEDGTVQTPGYSNYPDIPRADFNIGFDGLFVDAELTDPETVIDFPVEGGYGVTATAEDENGQMKQYNDLDIYSNFDHESWFLIDAPEWITEWQYNDDYVERGYVLFYFVADALPAGETGRQGAITLECYGKQIVIPVGQGDYVIDGIADVKGEKKADSRTFNMAGQQVTNGYKGFVIRDGKKYINK